MKLPVAIDENMPIYWEGRENLFVRCWVYLNRGLDFVNQARYWIVGTLGIYAVLKLVNPLWIAAIVMVSAPILILIGRWHLYRVAKTQEFIITTKGSVLGYKNYNLAVQQVELLKEILERLPYSRE